MGRFIRMTEQASALQQAIILLSLFMIIMGLGLIGSIKLQASPWLIEQGVNFITTLGFFLFILVLLEIATQIRDNAKRTGGLI